MKFFLAFEIGFFRILGSEIDESQACPVLLSFELLSTGRAHRANPAVSTTLIMHIKTTKKEVQIAATSAMIWAFLRQKMGQIKNKKKTDLFVILNFS